MIRCIPVSTCADCPFQQRHYGRFECAKFNFQPLPEQSAQNGIASAVPDWCPLPPHPSFNNAAQVPHQDKGEA